MDKPVVIIEDVGIEGRVRAAFAGLFEKTTVLAPNLASPAVIDAARGRAAALVVRVQPMRAAALAHLPNLKVVCAWGVGVDHLDLPHLTARKIPVCINPVASRSVAEAALLFILALSRRLPRLMGDIRTGRPLNQAERGLEVRGRTVGIIGLGRIGRETAELCRRLDMNVIACDPHLTPGSAPGWCQMVTLGQLLSAADFVVLTAPLTPETHHLLGVDQFNQMKPTAYVINIARGALIDEKALQAALEAGQIAGAGLDVWEEEPVPTSHPLLQLENVIPTPHKIGTTWESLDQICSSIQTNIFKVLANQRPDNVINPEVFDTPPG